jgi:alpha-glucosidase
MFDVLREMREVVDEYEERLLIGELYLPIDRLVAYYGPDGDILHLPHNFHLMRQAWDARHIGAVIDFYEGRLPDFAWPNWVLSNHDNPRMASRIGAGQARVAAMLLLTLRGTPTLYYADELGLPDVVIPSNLIQDPQERTIPGLHLGRDPERTPMQWDASPHAGFTSGTPWLPVSDDYPTLNVEAQRDDPRSMLTMQQRLIAVRRVEPALVLGDYAPLRTEGNLLAYTRVHDGRTFLIVLNLGPEAQELVLSRPRTRGHIVLNTHLDRENESVDRRIALRGDEGVVVLLD